MKERTSLASPLVSVTVPLALRLPRFDLLISRWRLCALPALILPEPERQKRFFAPDLVFILGISGLSKGIVSMGDRGMPLSPPPGGGAVYSGRTGDWQGVARKRAKIGPRRRAKPKRESATAPTRLLRRHHHGHLAAFHARRLFDLGHLVEPVLDAHQHAHADFLMRHLAAAEAHDHFHLVAFTDEFEHGAHLDVVVVIVDAGAELDLLDLDHLLLLARGVEALLLLVFVFAEIEDLADGGIGLGGDLDQIEGGFGGPGESLVTGDDADHVAALVHQAQTRRGDFVVDPRAVATRRGGGGNSRRDNASPLNKPPSKPSRGGAPVRSRRLGFQSSDGVAERKDFLFFSAQAADRYALRFRLAFAHDQ